MKRYIAFLGISSLMSAHMRDPFFYPQGKHHMVCAAIGSVDNRLFFAQLYVDAVLRMVRLHDNICEQTVISITPTSVSLRGADQSVHTLVLCLPQENDLQKKALQPVQAEGLGG